MSLPGEFYILTSLPISDGSQRKKKWQRRLRGPRPIGRLYFVHPSEGERFYLRLLLCHIPGARSFEELKTVRRVVCETFREAARSLHLLNDSEEWEQGLQEATVDAMPVKLRELFAVILVFNSPSNLYFYGKNLKNL
eukprot:Pompholyxophrys_punicea_v1_NODE_684_length_1459_cov_6.711538.p2 type:complete len:137 gc:universal NODE_684_length_1459_cov_6.711538:282-692(+)